MSLPSDQNIEVIGKLSELRDRGFDRSAQDIACVPPAPTAEDVCFDAMEYECNSEE